MIVPVVSDELFLKIVRAASKAPSGHNTQPWLFLKSDSGITIKPDFSRSLPATDPENRELFISLGCAAETAMIAAGYYGLNTEMVINKSDIENLISIRLSKKKVVEQPALFSFINTRQTARNWYESKAISEEILQELFSMEKEEGVSIHLFSEQKDILKFKPFILDANRLQLGDSDYKRELIQWMRFSKREALSKGDGLYTACIGAPSTGRTLGSFVMKHFYSAKSENLRLIKQLEHSSAIVLFSSRANDIEQWIRIGMTFQCFALITESMGLSHSYLNGPCQIAELRQSLMSALGIENEIPQLIIRLGYASKMEYSFRRVMGL